MRGLKPFFVAQVRSGFQCLGDVYAGYCSKSRRIDIRCALLGHDKQVDICMAPMPSGKPQAHKNLWARCVFLFCALCH